MKMVVGSSTTSSKLRDSKNGTAVMTTSPRQQQQQQQQPTNGLIRSNSRRRIDTATTTSKSNLISSPTRGTAGSTTADRSRTTNNGSNVSSSNTSSNSSSSISILRQWIQELDLEQDVDVIMNAMIAVGITTPQTFITLQPQFHFDSLHITSSNDKRKVFFLIQRIKHLLLEQQQQQEGGAIDDAAVPPNVPVSPVKVPTNVAVSNNSTNRSNPPTSGTTGSTAATTTRAVSSSSSQQQRQRSVSQGRLSMSKQSSTKSIASTTTSATSNLRSKENCRPSLSSSSSPLSATTISTTTTATKDSKDSPSVQQPQQQQPKKLMKSASDLLLDDVLNGTGSSSTSAATSTITTAASQLQQPSTKLRTPKASHTSRNQFVSNINTGINGGGISLRTGKQLSTIPSEQVPPMSPLIDYDLVVGEDNNCSNAMTRKQYQYRNKNTIATSVATNQRRRSQSFDDTNMDNDNNYDDDHHSVSSNTSTGSSNQLTHGTSYNRRRTMITTTGSGTATKSSTNNNSRRMTLSSKLEKQPSSSSALLSSSSASVVPSASSSSSFIGTNLTLRRSQSTKSMMMTSQSTATATNDGSTYSNTSSILGTMNDGTSPVSQQQSGFMINTMNTNINISFKVQIDDLRHQTNRDHEMYRSTTTSEAITTTEDVDNDEMRIRVIVRKRPMTTPSNGGGGGGDIDIIHPLKYDSYGRILVYQPKTRVDLTKQIDIIPFAFDNVYDETSTNQSIYISSIRNLIPSFFMGQWSSIFAYGQTGSGKTFTMMGNNFTGMTSSVPINDDVSNLGLYYMAALDIFHALQKPEYATTYTIRVSLFEIYSGKLFDLLNNRAAVKCLEDSKGNVCFPGLSEHPVSNANALMKLIVEGATLRSCGTTSRNADSSRSHAVLQLHLYRKGSVQVTKRKGGVSSSLSSSSRNGSEEEFSRLTFIDLAGSERGADTSNASRATRLEGAEINTSLLALKEVIRALATGDSLTHVPFRGSKLTQVLKQSFVGKNCRSVMIACISPNIGNCEQTLNTLRYADRVKERHPETGQLSLNLLSSGNGSRSITPTRKQPHAISEFNSMSNSIHNQSTLSQKSDLLDELLASPDNSSHGKEHDEFDDDTAVDTEVSLEGLAPRQMNAEISTRPSSSKRHSPSSDVLRELISTHVDSTEVMMEMIREEMSIVNTKDTTANQFDDYLTRVYTLQEEQLTMIKMLRELLSQYRSMDPASATTNQNSTLNYTDHLNESDTDDAFEDLRD